MTERRSDKLNSGITLIELLVVIAILGVVMALSTIGIGLLRSGDSKKASRTMQDILNEVRTDTLSIEADWKAKLQKVDGRYQIAIYRDGTETELKELGSRIDITYDDKDIAEGYEVTVAFNKSSGTVKEITYGPIGSEGISVKNEFNSSMVFSVNSSRKGDYTVTLYYDTGKVSGQE